MVSTISKTMWNAVNNILLMILWQKITFVILLWIVDAKCTLLVQLFSQFHPGMTFMKWMFTIFQIECIVEIITGRAIQCVRYQVWDFWTITCVKLHLSPNKLEHKIPQTAINFPELAKGKHQRQRIAKIYFVRNFNQKPHGK